MRIFVPLCLFVLTPGLRADEAKDPLRFVPAVADVVVKLERPQALLEAVETHPVLEQALKIALPVTCFIIALFGAPLAVTTPRAGAAVGIAISLGTTIIFLLLTQITKAVGAGGLLDPLAAAWIPNALFLFAGIVLFFRTRT